MTVPPLRAALIFPSWESLIHFSKLWSPVRPRVRVTSPAFHRPGSCLIMYLPSLVFCFSSITSCSSLRPETSWMFLIITPSTSMPKEWPTELSKSGRGMPHLSLYVGADLLDQACAARVLRQAEDDELGRLHRGDADLADDLPEVDPLSGVRLVVALHEERLLGREPEERTLAPLHDQEGADGPADLGPQGLVVRLEDDPLGTAEYGLLHVVEETADVQVAPRGVARQCAGAPDPDAASREGPDAV